MREGRATGVPAAPARPSRRRPGGWAAVLLWGAGILMVAGGLVAADRTWTARGRVDPADPAVRVAGAVRSLSGGGSVRRAVFEPATGRARVAVTSRYYDPGRPVSENREYLATEGRMAAQLALFDTAAVQEVTIELYGRRTLLATVTGRQGQAYGEMPVQYLGPLGGP